MRPPSYTEPHSLHNSQVVRALVDLGVITPSGDLLSVRRSINYFIENIQRQTERKETIQVRITTAFVSKVVPHEHQSVARATGEYGHVLHMKVSRVAKPSRALLLRADHKCCAQFLSGML